MTGEETFNLFVGNMELRQYIVDKAKTMSRNPLIQEALIDTAWVAIGKLQPQKTDEYYRRMCNLLMHRCLAMGLYKEVVTT